MQQGSKIFATCGCNKFLLAVQPSQHLLSLELPSGSSAGIPLGSSAGECQAVQLKAHSWRDVRGRERQGRQSSSERAVVVTVV